MPDNPANMILFRILDTCWTFLKPPLERNLNKTWILRYLYNISYLIDMVSTSYNISCGCIKLQSEAMSNAFHSKINMSSCLDGLSNQKIMIFIIIIKELPQKGRTIHHQQPLNTFLNKPHACIPFIS